MKKAIQAEINTALTKMGIPDFTKSVVITKALSELSQEINLPVDAFDISHVPPELQKLVETSAKALLKIVQRAMLSDFLAALLETAQAADISMAEEEAKNAVLM